MSHNSGKYRVNRCFIPKSIFRIVEVRFYNDEFRFAGVKKMILLSVLEVFFSNPPEAPMIPTFARKGRICVCLSVCLFVPHLDETKSDRDLKYGTHTLQDHI